MTIQNAAISRSISCLLTIIVLVCGFLARAQSIQSTSIDSGTLSWSWLYGTHQCGSEGQLSYTESTYGSFSFLSQAGTSYSLNGSAIAYFNSPGTSYGCPPDLIEPSVVSLSLPSIFSSDGGNDCVLSFTPGDYGPTSVTASSTCIAGPPKAVQCAQPATSVSILGGTLSWSQTGPTTSSCAPPNTYTETTYSSFSFCINTSSTQDATYPLGGGGVYFISPGTSEGCPPNGPQPSSISIPMPSNFGSGCVITFDPGEYGPTSVSASSTCQ